MLNKINNLHKEICEKIVNYKGRRSYYYTKECQEKIKEVNQLTIEYNKQNNVYYTNETWIYDVINDILKVSNVTGNELLEEVANQLNKMNGVLLEEHYEKNQKNYIIYVVTPYTTYMYQIFRGYNGYCTTVPFKPDNFTNKFKTKLDAVSSTIELFYKNGFEEAEQKGFKYLKK